MEYNASFGQKLVSFCFILFHFGVFQKWNNGVSHLYYTSIFQTVAMFHFGS